MPVDPDHGIVTLGMVRVPDWKGGTSALATDARRCERWWQVLGFPKPPPAVLNRPCRKMIESGRDDTFFVELLLREETTTRPWRPELRWLRNPCSAIRPEP